MTTPSAPSRTPTAGGAATQPTASGVGSAPVDFEERFQQAPCGYLITADDGTITDVNDTFAHWSGHRRTDLVGTRLQRLLPIGDQILYSTHCTPQLRMGGAVAELLIEVIGADGDRRAALLSAARTPEHAGIPAEVRVIIFSAHRRQRYERELVAALHRAEESESRRASAEADLQHLALHDPLTGLPNRAGLSSQLDAACADRAATGGGLGVLVIDLDHFKAVNDSLGHAAGDELLTVVACRLTSAVRDSATVARLSGDEFVIIDELADAPAAGRLAARLLEVLTAPVVLEGLEVVTSASIGAALADGHDDTSDGLLRQADIAMYKAKSHGRNRWEIHDPSRTDPLVDRLRLLGELRRGIAGGELRAHYQPRMDLRSGDLNGVEALVRWQHPTRGLLPPSEFIEVAEDSGLIRDLGAWVLDEAVAQAVRWRATTAGPAIEMAVNLSTRQLTDPGLVTMVADVLRRHGLQPGLLTLEITETALMENPDTALDTLTALKELGVGLAIDDFGTGYASLTYLQRFPIDELKIDRSFVMGMELDTGDAAIVASCIHLAHAVGIRAVAEGVETDGQRAALLDLDCDLAQGYHYARPLPPDAFDVWLDQR